MIQRNRLRAAGLLAVAMVAGGLTAACGDDSGSDQVSVSLITKNSTNPFFVAMQDGAKEAADRRAASS